VTLTHFDRSAPLPVRVEGFSVGAVIGFSSQDTLVCLANDDDINAFKAVSRPDSMDPYP